MRVLAAGKRLQRHKNVCHTTHASTSKRIILSVGFIVAALWRCWAISLLLHHNGALPPTASQWTLAAAKVPSTDKSPDRNETVELVNEIKASLDSIIAKQAEMSEAPQQTYDTDEAPSSHQSSSLCAPREGLVISNTMGRLANNMFEVGFANRLATDLCWKVLFRPHWQGEIPNPRAAECFPHSMLPKDHATLDNIPATLQEKLKLNSTFWDSVKTTKGNRQFMSWFADRQNEGIAQKVGNDGSLFVGDAPHRLVLQIRNETSQTSLLSLEAFFIHGDWMNEWSAKVREWFRINEACCHHRPPEDAVVIHVRDFAPRDQTNMGIKPAVYTHIMNQYNLTDRPLWIVCQSQTIESSFVKQLTAAFPNKNVTIVPGQDQYDAFCTLTRAKTLLLTSASSFSQMAAFLSDAQVHYPLKTQYGPKVTLSVPEWKYHLVDHKTLDMVNQFEVNRDNIRFKAA